MNPGGLGAPRLLHEDVLGDPLFDGPTSSLDESWEVERTRPEAVALAVDIGEAIDLRARAGMRRYGLIARQISVGIIFLWFGGLKLVPGLSPAEGLVIATASELFGPIGLPMPGRLVVVSLALVEIAIGFAFLFDWRRRMAIWLLIVHMFSTFLPLLLLPEVVWTLFPIGLTIEGQYIIKNLAILGAAAVVGATIDDPMTQPDLHGSSPDPADPTGDRSDPRVWIVDESGSLLATYELDGYYGPDGLAGPAPASTNPSLSSSPPPMRVAR